MYRPSRTSFICLGGNDNQLFDLHFNFGEMMTREEHENNLGLCLWETRRLFRIWEKEMDKRRWENWKAVMELPKRSNDAVGDSRTKALSVQASSITGPDGKPL